MTRSFVVFACLLAPFFAAAQEPWENPVRKLLQEGKPVVGPSVSVNNIEVAARLADVGFDFLWIEMEHGPITLETLRNMVLATKGLQAMPFVRVPINELWTAKRVLDTGVLGVAFPFVGTPELARQAVAACKYPPEGLRGYGPKLASFRAPSAEPYHEFANRNVLVMAVVEDQSAVDHIDEIAAVPGLDVIVIGPSDLSFRLGVPRQPDHPKMKAAIAKIVAAAKRHNKFLGRPAANADQVKEYGKQGFQFFLVPGDLALMQAGARQLLDPLGK